MHSNTAVFSPAAERIASIRDERPYFTQCARAISAACGGVIPATGMDPRSRCRLRSVSYKPTERVSPSHKARNMQPASCSKWPPFALCSAMETTGWLRLRRCGARTGGCRSHRFRHPLPPVRPVLTMLIMAQVVRAWPQVSPGHAGRRPRRNCRPPELWGGGER